LPLLHGLEKAALGPWGRSIDLVRQDEVGEDRPEADLEFRSAGVENRYTQDVGREEVTRELDASEREAQGGREGMSERCLSYSGDVLEEDMPARQQRRYGKTHDLFFTVENLLYLRDQPVEQIE
jgi:hypothetical protein